MSATVRTAALVAVAAGAGAVLWLAFAGDGGRERRAPPASTPAVAPEEAPATGSTPTTAAPQVPPLPPRPPREPPPAPSLAAPSPLDLAVEVVVIAADLGAEPLAPTRFAGPPEAWANETLEEAVAVARRASNTTERVNALHFLGEHAGAGLSSTVMELEEDPDPEVRAAAEAAADQMRIRLSTRRIGPALRRRPGGTAP
jgi:hypothetical protein